jgi:hypothetical protein
MGLLVFERPGMRSQSSHTEPPKRRKALCPILGRKRMNSERLGQLSGPVELKGSAGACSDSLEGSNLARSPKMV